MARMVNEDASTKELLLLMKTKQTEANKACAILYSRFMSILCHYGKYLGLSSADAEDIAQDTLIQVIKNISMFNELCGDGKAWIYMIYKNKVTDLLRRKGVIQFESLAEIHFCFEQDLLEQWVENDHLRQTIYRAWRCLPVWAQQELQPRSRPGRKSKKWHQARDLFDALLAEEREND